MEYRLSQITSRLTAARIGEDGLHCILSSRLLRLKLHKRKKDTRGFNYVVRFPHKIRLGDEREPRATVWFNVNKEGTDGGAEEAAWNYFVEVQRRYARQRVGDDFAGMPDRFGPLRKSVVDEKY